MFRYFVVKIVCLAVLVTTMVYGGYNDWPGYANTVQRNSIAVDGPNVIDSNTLNWVADTSPQGYDLFEFESATGPVLYNDRIYAIAKYLEPNEAAFTGYDQTASQLIAYDANSGQRLWHTIIDSAVWGSWSLPAVDKKNNTILIASGNVTADGMYALPANLYSIDIVTGSILWSTQLDTAVLNSSVCVPEDLEYSRAFMTDYDGFGTTGKLYCVNLDANEPNNPYLPGEIIWSDNLGSTNNNTPAYKDGVVYVTSGADIASGYGAIYAYDATANTPIRKWTATDPNFDGFAGGVTLTKAGFLYAACYDWSDQSQNNSPLCKIDCNDGSIIWITQTERTNTLPVVVGDKIYISGGTDGYGSRRKITAYQDLGPSVLKLWETPDSMDVGGRSNQPIYANGKLYVGGIEDDSLYYTYSYLELYILNPEAVPTSSEFVISHYTDLYCGNSPAVTCDSLYTIGINGLIKFHQPALLADIDGDLIVDYYDLAKLAQDWLCDEAVGTKRADLNLDGRIDFADFGLLAGMWYGEID